MMDDWFKKMGKPKSKPHFVIDGRKVQAFGFPELEALNETG